MAWIYLAIASVLEVVWAFSMKHSDGFTRLVPSTITLVAMLGSFALLAMAMRTLPLGTAYPVWTGLGAVGAFAVGVLVLGEQMNAFRVSGAAMILGGLLLLKMQ